MSRSHPTQDGFVQDGAVQAPRTVHHSLCITPCNVAGHATTLPPKSRAREDARSWDGAC